MLRLGEVPGSNPVLGRFAAIARRVGAAGTSATVLLPRRRRDAAWPGRPQDATDAARDCASAICASMAARMSSGISTLRKLT